MHLFKRIFTCITAGIMICAIGNVHVSSSSTTESRTYVKRGLNSLGSPNSYSTYTLSLSSDSNGISSYSVPGVIGSDDRYPDTNSSIVRFTFSYSEYTGSFTSYGTGFIINDNTIVTAAHCLYHKKSKDYMRGITIYLTDPVTGEQRRCTPKEVHIPKQYIDCSDDDSHKYDYAMLIVDTDLTDYGTFSLGVLEEGLKRRNNIPITVSGYPAELQGADGTVIKNKDYQLYTGTDYLLASDSHTFWYDTDASGGDSGSPTYVSVEYQIGNQTPYVKNTVVGICVGNHPYDSNGDGVIDIYDEGSKNESCRITAPLLQFFLDNPNVTS